MSFRTFVIPKSSYLHDLPYPKGEKIGRQRQPYLRVWLLVLVSTFANFWNSSLDNLIWKILMSFQMRLNFWQAGKVVQSSLIQLDTFTIRQKTPKQMHQKYFGNVRKSERVNAQQEQPQMAFILLDIYMNTVIHLLMKFLNRFALKNLKK